jgi:hypothetical protein
MPGQAWTSDDLAEADRLVRGGAQIGEVAGAIGRTTRAVQLMRTRRRAAGHEVPTADPWVSRRSRRAERAERRAASGRAPRVLWSEADLARVERLIGEGLSMREVALSMGRTPAALASMRWRRRREGQRVPVSNLRRQRPVVAPAGFDLEDSGEL